MVKERAEELQYWTACSCALGQCLLSGAVSKYKEDIASSVGQGVCPASDL